MKFDLDHTQYANRSRHSGRSGSIKEKIICLISNFDFRPLLLYSALLVWAAVGVMFLMFTPAGEALTAGDQIVQLPQDESPAAPAVQEGLDRLLDQNADTVGRIRIHNTVVDYPVVQSRDNTYYTKNDFNGQASELGAIFLDSACTLTSIGSSGNVIIYGRIADNGEMFAALLNYKNEAFFRNNPMIEFDTLSSAYSWEIFSVYEMQESLEREDAMFTGRKGFQEYVKRCKKRSIYDSGVTPEEGDTILTLAAYTDELSGYRFVVQAKLA